MGYLTGVSRDLKIQRPKPGKADMQPYEYCSTRKAPVVELTTLTSCRLDPKIEPQKHEKHFIIGGRETT
jgi:hypothetical protein